MIVTSPNPIRIHTHTTTTHVRNIQLGLDVVAGGSGWLHSDEDQLLVPALAGSHAGEEAAEQSLNVARGNLRVHLELRRRVVMAPLLVFPLILDNHSPGLALPPPLISLDDFNHLIQCHVIGRLVEVFLLFDWNTVEIWTDAFFLEFDKLLQHAVTELDSFLVVLLEVPVRV